MTAGVNPPRSEPTMWASGEPIYNSIVWRGRLAVKEDDLLKKRLGIIRCLPPEPYKWTESIL